MIRRILAASILGVAIWGLAPRPLFAPDWRTPLSVALASGDCASIERIAELLQITGHERESSRVVVDLAAQKKCKYAALDDEAISREKFWAERTSSDTNFLKRIIVRSRLVAWARSEAYLARDSSQPLFISAERRMSRAARECYDKMEPIAGGIPDEILLEYGLNNPNVEAEAIWRIAFAQRSRCVSEFFKTALILEDLAVSQEEIRRVSIVANHANIHLGYAPELAADMRLLDDRLAARGYDGVFSREPGDGWCIYSLDGINLWSAIQCATEKNELRNPDVSTVYFAARARRLGWRDIGPADMLARERLPPECVAAIVKLEAEETGGSGDPRDFRRLEWPAGPGEVCEDALR